MKTLKAIFCLIVSLFAVNAAQTKCKLNDKNLNDCVKNSVQENFPKLHNPTNNKDFPLIDPYFFDFGKVTLNRSEQVQGSFAIKNMTIVGGNTMKFEQVAVKINDKKMEVKAKVFIPKTTASGWFKSELFTFNAKGTFKCLNEEISANLIIIGNLADKKFTVTSYDMLPTVKNIKFNLKGIGADENLIKLANQLVNDSWKPLYRDIIAETKSVWQPIALSLMNELFGLIDFE